MKILYLFISTTLFSLLSCRKELHSMKQEGIDPRVFHNRSIGSSASELLDDKTFKFLMVEIQYVQGFKPNAGTIDHLKTFLDTYINKPGGIDITMKALPANVNDALSMEEVSAVEKKIPEASCKRRYNYDLPFIYERCASR